jgi:peptide chain release factor 2
MLNDPDVWQDQEKARSIGQEISRIREEKNLIDSLMSKIENLQAYAELIDQDPSLESEAKIEAKDIEKILTNLELKVLFSESYDSCSAILSIHPGAGGTESQDWAQMLLRMYSRWAEKVGFVVEIADLLPGEVAGIKSATVFIKGINSYGFLKGETGVHRLVRISPFDANKRRHTSFASIEILPEVTDEVKVEIREEDLKIDTFRASGAGGQHVNRTESAVRLTHLPSGIVVSCQNERSQHQNKALALRILKAKLFEIEMQKRQKEMEKLAGKKTEIGWGRQIRSYVFQPYSLIKDLRTGYETGNVQPVMDGDIDEFLKTYLIFQKTGKKVKDIEPQEVEE